MYVIGQSYIGEKSHLAVCYWYKVSLMWNVPDGHKYACKAVCHTFCWLYKAVIKRENICVQSFCKDSSLYFSAFLSESCSSQIFCKGSVNIHRAGL